MKKLLFVLLFTPLMSFSQEITFNDLMSINSIDTFKRVVIENSYEFDGLTGGYLSYGYNLTVRTDKESTASKWGMFNIDSYGFVFQFIKRHPLVELEFDRIVSEIKSKCEYYKINGEYVTYNCPDSSFKGQIGFKTSEGSGLIMSFRNFEKD